MRKMLTTFPKAAVRKFHPIPLAVRGSILIALPLASVAE